MKPGKGASGDHGHGYCEGSWEAGAGCAGLRRCLGGEETEKPLKNLGGKGEERGRAVADSEHEMEEGGFSGGRDLSKSC